MFTNNLGLKHHRTKTIFAGGGNAAMQSTGLQLSGGARRFLFTYIKLQQPAEGDTNLAETSALFPNAQSMWKYCNPLLLGRREGRSSEQLENQHAHKWCQSPQISEEACATSRSE